MTGLPSESDAGARRWIGRRLALWGAAALAALSIFLLADYVVARLTLNPQEAPEPQLGADFINFWLGARFAAEGQAAAVYDRELLFSVQQSVIGTGAIYKVYSYPPVALLLTLPFAAFPFVVALVLWTVAGWALTATVLSRLTGGMIAALVAIGAPAAFMNVLSGQNGTFTAAILGGGLLLLDRRPVVAGLVWGLLAGKPQMGLLLPIALLAGRCWPAVLGAALSAGLLMGASVALFGIDAWTAFFEQMTYHGELLALPHDDWFRRMPTVFAALRLAGAPLGAAYAGQAVSAAIAVIGLAWIWYRRASLEIRNATLIVAIVLASPYAWDYDLIVLLFAAAWLARRGIAEGFLAGEQALVLVLATLPVFMVAGDLAIGVQLGPVVLWLTMAALLRRAWRERATELPAAALPSARQF